MARLLLFIFHGAQLALFTLGWRLQQTNGKLAALNHLRWSVWSSRGAALVLALDAALLLVPVLRSLITLLRPKSLRLLPPNTHFWLHRHVAYSMAFWTVVHTTSHYVNFFTIELTQDRADAALHIHYTQAGGITGHFMLLVMLLIYTTAHHKIRHQCFEAFWYTHHLAPFFFLALSSHATGCFVRDSVDPDYTSSFPFYSTKHCLGYQSWRFTIWPAVIYFAERMYRAYRAMSPTTLSNVFARSSGVMELRIIKPGFNYAAGQWLFIQVPEISTFQWHPFTITSAPEDPYVSIHLRQVGDWTRALGKRLGCDPTVVAAVAAENSGFRRDYVKLVPSSLSHPLPRVRIDGPYGVLVDDVFDNEVAVLIGAGIGVTPFASILKHIWYRQHRGNLGSIRRVEFFWVCRNASSFGWFQSLLQQIETAQVDPDFLRINIYLTQKVDENMLWNIAINDVSAEYDPLTLLRTRTMFGRPDWNRIYRCIREAIETGRYPLSSTAHLKTRVGTYFCGPVMLARAIKEVVTLQHTSNNTEFTFAEV